MQIRFKAHSSNSLILSKRNKQVSEGVTLSCVLMDGEMRELIMSTSPLEGALQGGGGGCWEGMEDKRTKSAHFSGSGTFSRTGKTWDSTLQGSPCKDSKREVIQKQVLLHELTPSTSGIDLASVLPYSLHPSSQFLARRLLAGH